MKDQQVELLVLDAHGVVLTNPFFSVLDRLARATGQAPAEVSHRWRSELRTPTWTGLLPEDSLWRQLTGSDNGRHWRDVLEGAYELGSAAPHLQRWSGQVPVWLLSNHRSDWLLPRLERFELTRFFQRVIISDAIGVAKPEPAAFAEIFRHTGRPAAAMFVDDQPRNVAAAVKLGIHALLADADESWISAVDHALRANVTPV